MKENSSIPTLKFGQRSVVLAETGTGILLTPEGERYIGEGQLYTVFNSEDEAITFAEDYVAKHPTIECSIRDEEGKHLKFIREPR